MNEKNAAAKITERGKPSGNNAGKWCSRRKFLGQVGAAVTGGALLGKPVLAYAESSNTSFGDGIHAPASRVDPRVRRCFAIRLETANDEARIPVPPHTTNGDEERYPDKRGTYGKGILQDGIGLVNLNAFQTFKRALNSGNPEDFENIIMGGTRTLNGPQGGLAFALEGSDAVQFGNAPCPNNQENAVVVPPAPALASAAYGTELVERILGIGDQGAGGLGIPIGKLSLYTLIGGIRPERTLPIVLDVGTNNQERLNDPEYLGWRHERITGQDYFDFIDQFVQAVKQEFPETCLQWEDFANSHARPILERYRDELLTFNDDIQGTAAVALGAILAAVKVTGRSLKDQQIVVFGAGSAAGTQAQKDSVAAKLGEDELRQRVTAAQWTPNYPSYC